MSILIFNGSPSGQKGNCDKLIKNISARLHKNESSKKTTQVKIIHLAEFKWTQADQKKLFTQLKSSRGFIFVTGTYWDSWGSPLQQFLENVTDLEGQPEFLGKPAIVCVLNHSVGGKGVLSRLQGVLSTFGCLIPPMSGIVYSWVADQLAQKKSFMVSQEDLWSLDDLDPILENFTKALQLNVDWKSWPVDRKNFRKIWLK